MQRYYLIHRFGWTDALEYSNQAFSTENEAMSRACSLISAGELGKFFIRDGSNQIVADDKAIRERCKTISI